MTLSNGRKKLIQVPSFSNFNLSFELSFFLLVTLFFKEFKFHVFGCLFLIAFFIKPARKELKTTTGLVAIFPKE